jgi:hypothetical protein
MKVTVMRGAILLTTFTMVGCERNELKVIPIDNKRTESSTASMSSPAQVTPVTNIKILSGEISIGQNVEMVPIEGGCFEMGGPSREPGRDKDDCQKKSVLKTIRLQRVK